MPKQPNHPHSRRKLWLKKRREAAAQSDDKPAMNERVAKALAEAGALVQRMEVGRAEALLEQVADPGAGGSAEQLLHAGRLFAAGYRPERALACYERAAERADGLMRAQAQIELAGLHERRGELDQASAVLDRVEVSAYAERDGLRARLCRRQGNHDQARQLLEPLTRTPTIHPMTRARAGYELARLHDEQCDYAAAWDALLAAKLAQATLIKPGQIDEARQRLTPHRKLIDQVTAADFARWQRDAAQLADDLAASPRAALLTGLPRSGTTLLERVLDAHPGVLGADERHVLARVALPGLFDQLEPPADPVAAFDAVPAPRLAQQRARYFELMAQSLGEPLGDRLLLDKNPAMLRLLPGVRRLLPQSPVLVALRDPRDVLVSMLFTWMPMNEVSVQLLSAQDAAHYIEQELGAWLALREKMRNWTELRYEELVEDLPAVARRAIEAMGLAWDEAVLGYADRAASGSDTGRQVDSPTYEQVNKPVYASAVGRWRHYAAQLEQSFTQLGPVIDRLSY